MADSSRLRNTEQWEQLAPEAQQQLETMYQQASPEEQTALMQQLTPRGLAQTAKVVSWFPGFEWMHALPEQTQQQVVRTVGETAEKAAEPGMEPMVGELIGSSLPVGPWRALTGAAGAAVGEGVRQWRAGESLYPYGMLREGIASAVPGVFESAGRAAVRQVARQSPGGQRILGSHATEEARQVPERVFQPRPAEQISEAFEQVRRTGLPIETEGMTGYLQTLSPGKQSDVLSILTQIDTKNRTGHRYADLYKNLMSKTPTPGAPTGVLPFFQRPVTPAPRVTTQEIGALQTLRSDLRKYAETIPREAGEARLLVRDLQNAVDETIDAGLATGANAAQAPAIRDQLHQARRDYAHRMAADEMSDLIEDKIRSSPNLRDETLNLKGIWDELRRGRTEASRSINRSLDMTPGARERFNTEMERLTRHYENVALPMTDVQGIWRYPVAAGMRQTISQVLLTERGRQMFERAIIEGRGRISPNAFAALVNEVRRETMPELTQERQESKGVQSWFAPGGVARQTD